MTTGLRANNDGSAAIEVGGSDAVNLSAALNVGIGTASPAYKLHVYDAANAFLDLQAGAGSPLLVGQDSNGDAFLLNVRNATLRLGTNNTEQARIAATGAQSSTIVGFSGLYPEHKCRAWVNFNGQTNVGGFCTIRASGNVSTVADGGVGIYTVNLATAMPDADFATVGTVLFSTIGNKGGIEVDSTGSNPTTTATRLRTYTGSAAAADCFAVYVSIFR